MEFENSFSVAAPLEQVWTYLLDVKAVAPCVPGAELTEIVSDTEFKGAVKIKLGAVQVNYRGTVVLKEVDNEAHRVVIVATGSETRGTGSASGTVTSTAVQDGQRTTVRMLSEIVVTGRVAQFGRNIMQDVSSKLIKDFAACVEAHLKKPDVEQPAVADVSESSGSREQSSAAGSEMPPAEDAAEVARPAPSAPATPTRPTGSGSYASAELKLGPLLADITRSRVARGLRAVAKLVDPDKP